MKRTISIYQFKFFNVFQMPKQPVQLNFSYLPCLERFPTMVACFRDAAHHEVQDQHIRLA